MYRTEQLRCGYCSTLLEVVPVPLPQHEPVAADVCPACSAVFLEYFDGEAIGIAAALLQLRPELARLALESNVDGSPREVNPDDEPCPGHCPGCGGADLSALRYLEGPTVARCHGCLSLSATQAQLVALARHRVGPSAPKSIWTRLRAWARRRLAQQGMPPNAPD